VLDTRALVSRSVSKLGCINLHFIEAGAKINYNEQYYRDVLLTQKLLPAIRRIAGDMFVSSKTMRQRNNNLLALKALSAYQSSCS